MLRPGRAFVGAQTDLDRAPICGCSRRFGLCAD